MHEDFAGDPFLHLILDYGDRFPNQTRLAYHRNHDGWDFPFRRVAKYRDSYPE